MENEIKCGIFVNMSFGAILRKIRVQNMVTLRDRCKKLGMDAGNYSKLERSLLAPPQFRKEVDRLLKHLVCSPLDRKALYSAAFNHHIGILQERFK